MTTLGNEVAGNPALAMGSAGIILNQVVGSHASLLEGVTEIAGQRADLIIANPNGIVCNGGGFINTGRSVLTTGVPILGVNGGLEAFRVTGGQLEIGPKGLNAQAFDPVDLIARSLQVNGELRTLGALNVVTGPNRVAYADLGVQILPDAAGSPTVGVDVAQLGSMYAHKIHLVGTDAGVGVNSLGLLTAKGDSFTCTQEGRIVLTGDTTAGGNLELNSTEGIVNQGTVFTEGAVSLKSKGTVVNDQGKIAAQQVDISAFGLSNRGGAIAQQGPGVTRIQSKGGLDNTAGVIVSNGKDLQIRSFTLQNDKLGQIVHAGAGRLSIQTGTLNNDGGLLTSKGAFALSATQDLSNVEGTIHAGRFLNVHGRNVINDGGQIASLGGGLTLIADRKVSNAPGTTAANLPGGLIGGKADTAIHADTVESSGTILGGQHLTLEARTLTNRGTIQAVSRVEAKAETLNNQGHLAAPSVALKAPTLDNSLGQVKANDLTVEAVDLTNAGGTLTHLGEGPMPLSVTGKLTNTEGGLIETQSQDLTLAPMTLDNHGGTIAHAGTGILSVTAGAGRGELINRSGSIATNGKLTLSAATLDNQGGTVAAQKQLEAAVLQGDLDNRAHEGKAGFIGGDQVRVVAWKGKLLNQGGTLEGSRGVDLNVQALDNRDGALRNTGEAPLVVTTRERIDNKGGFIGSRGETRIGADQLVNDGQGIVSSGTDLEIKASTIDNPGSIGALRTVTLRASRTLDNSKGELTAGTLDLNAAQLINKGGKLTQMGSQPMILKVTETLTNTEGGVIQSRATDLQVETKRLENEGGTIGHLGTGTLTVGSQKGDGILHNAEGKIASLGQLDLSAGAIHNQGGTLAAQKAVKLVVTEGVLDNSAKEGKPGTIGAETVQVEAKQGRVLNQGGTIEGSAGVDLQTQSLDNTKGNLTNTGQGHLTVTAALNLGNAEGTLGSNGQATLKATTIDNAHGLLQGGDNLTLEATQSIDNRAGMAHANQNLHVNAAGVENAEGQLSASSGVHVKAAALENTGGNIAAGQDLQLETPTMPSGQLHGGRDRSFHFQGDYTHPAEAILASKRNLTLTTTGTFTNHGSLTAPTSVTVEAAKVHNEPSGLIHGGAIHATAVQALTSTGRILGDEVTLKADQDLIHGGTLVAQANATLTSTQGLVRNTGTVASQQKVDLQAVTVEATGKLGAGLNAQGIAVNPGDLVITATGAITASGENTAGGQIAMTGASLAMPAAKTHAGGNITLTTTTGDLVHTEGATLHARGVFQATVAGAMDNGTSQIKAHQVKASAASLGNQGGSIAQAGPGETVIESKGVIDNTGGIILNALGAANIGAGAQLTNTHGVLQSMGLLTVKGGTVTNDGGEIVAIGGDVDLTATKHLSNVAGTSSTGTPTGVIKAQRDAILHADTLGNAGTIASDRNLTLDARTLDNPGAIGAKGDATLTLTERFTHPGTASAGQNLRITAPVMDATGHLGAGLDAAGQAVNPGALTVTTTGNLTATGENAAGGQLTFQALSLSLPKAKTHAGGDITLTATAGDIDHTGGNLRALGKLTAKATAGALKNDSGQIDAGLVSAEAIGLSNPGGAIRQSGTEKTVMTLTGRLDNTAEGLIKTNATDVSIKATELLNDRTGKFEHAGAGLLEITTGHLGNQAGSLITNGRTVLNATTLTNDGGTLSAKQTADLTVTGDVSNTGGALQSDGDLKLKGGSITNLGGRMIAAAGDADVTATGHLHNKAGLTAKGLPGGLIKGQANTILHADSLENDGDLAGGGQLTLETRGLLDNRGRMDAKVLTQLTSKEGRIQNTGTVSAQGNVILNAVEVDSTGKLGAGVDAEGKTLASGQLEVTTTRDLKATGQNTAGADLTFKGGQVLMSGAQTGAGGSITLTATTGAIQHVLGAKLKAGGQFIAQATAGALVNDQSRIEAQQVTATTAGVSNLRGEIIQLGGAPTLLDLKGALHNAAGTLTTQAKDLTIHAAEVTNPEKGEIRHDGTGHLLMTTGLLNNQGGTVATSGQATITAIGPLTNDAGMVSAKGAATITVTEDLSNARGMLEAGGEFKVGGRKITNDGGRIIATGSSLTLTAQGPLENQAGDTAAGTKGGMVSAKTDATLNATSLTNTADLIAGGKLTVATQGLMDNRGTLEAKGTIDLSSKTKIRNSGTVAAQHDLMVDAPEIEATAEGKLGAGLNGDGKAVLAGSLTIKAPGKVTASGKNLAGGDVTIEGAQLSMGGARTQAQGKVQLTATTGPIEHNLKADLQAQGAVTITALQGALNNDGSKIHAPHLGMKAASLANQKGELVQSGPEASLLEFGGPAINTGGTIKSHGQNLTLKASSIDNTEKGQLEHAGTGVLNLTTGRLNNEGGTVATHGQAEVTATALVNKAGMLSAKGSATLMVSEAITNAQGTLVAGGDLGLKAPEVTNEGGRIIANGGNLTVAAQARLVNAAGTMADGTLGGVLSAKGTNDLNANSLTNTGTMVGGGTLIIDAQKLVNSGSLDAGGTLKAYVGDRQDRQGQPRAAVDDPQLDNTGGNMTAGEVTVHASKLTNKGGKLTQTGPGTMDLTVATALNNTGAGQIKAAGEKLKVTAQTMDNSNGILEQAGTGDLNLTVTQGVLANSSGTIATNGQLTLSAPSIGNQGGTLAAQKRASVTATQGPIHNAHVNGQGGFIGGSQVDLTALQGPLVNETGRVEGSHGVTLQAQELNNAGGSVKNTVDGALAVTVTQKLDNRHGLIGGKGATSVGAGRLDNAQGKVLSAADLTVTSSSTLANDGGVLQSGTQLTAKAQGDLTNVGGRIEGGTMEAQTPLTVTAANIDNTSARIVNAGKGDSRILGTHTITNRSSDANPEQGVMSGAGKLTISAPQLHNIQGAKITAADLTLDASQSLDNTGSKLFSSGPLTVKGPHTTLTNISGLISAEGDITLNVGTLDNTRGEVGNAKAGVGNVTLTAQQAVTNAQGKLTSGQDLVVTASKVSGSGTIAGGQDASLNVQGDLTFWDGKTPLPAPAAQSAQVSPFRGRRGPGPGRGSGWQSHHQTQASASSQAPIPQPIAPEPTPITATRNLTLTTTGTLTNRGILEAPRIMTVEAGAVVNTPSGLINGQTTHVTSDTGLANAGRIYGDQIALRASIMKNHSTGGPSGIVAARQSLHIGAGQVENLGKEALLSGEQNVTIGGSLDANHRAYGKANAINNQGATIQSGSGTVSLDAGLIQNSNPTFRMEQVLQHQQNNLVLIQPKGESKEYFAAQLTPSNGQNGVSGCWLVPTGRMVPKPLSILPSSFGNLFASNGRQVQLQRQPAVALQMIPETALVHDYTEFQVKRSTTTTMVLSSQPGKILAAGDMTIAGDAIHNTQSEIIAGGHLLLPRGKVANSGETGKTVATDEGQSRATHTVWKGGGIGKGKGHRQRKWSDWTPYRPAPKEKPFPLGVTKTLAMAPRPVAKQPGYALSGNHQPGTPTQGVAIAGHAGLALPGSDAGTPAVPAASGGTPQAAMSGQLQTVGDASTPLPDLSLLASRVVQVDQAPGAASHYVTDPAFLKKEPSAGLDHMLAKLAVDPAGTRRMADALLEAQMVSAQIRQLTGSMFLTKDATDIHQEFINLMENGLAAAATLNLQPGVMPTEAQLAALTQDCVWLVKQRVTQDNGDLRMAYVPVVLLARERTANLKPTGALISARTITADLTGSLENSGTILANNLLNLNASNLQNKGQLRTTEQGSAMNLSAQEDLVSQGTIQGHKVTARAGRDVSFQTTTVDTQALSGTWTGLAQVAQVSADALFVEAGRNVELRAAQIRTTGDATFVAGEDMAITHVNTGSSMQVGSGDHRLRQSETWVNGAHVDTGGNLHMKTGKDFNATAAQMSAGKAFKAEVGGSATLNTADQTSHFEEAHRFQVDGFMSTFTHQDEQVRSSRRAVGNSITAGQLEFKTNQDFTVIGSGIGSTGDLNIEAGGDITVKAGLHEHQSSSHSHETMSGLSSGGSFAMSYGESEETHQYRESATTQSQSRSILGSTHGNASFTAGGKATFTATDTVAGGNLNVTAKAVAYLPGLDEESTSEQHDSKQTALTLGVNCAALDAAQDLVTHAQGALEAKGNGTVAALHGLAAAGRVKALAKQRPATAAALAEGGAQGVAAAAGVSIAASVGTSQSRSEASAQAQTHSGALAHAGGKATITATEGDVEFIGSTLTAKAAAVTAAERVVMKAATDTTSSRGSNSSSGGSLGLSAGIGPNGVGLAVNVSANRSKGSSHGDSATHQDAVFAVDDLLQIKSGTDTIMSGAQAKGGTVDLDVGNDLIIASQSDTFKQASKQDSAGISASIPIAGAGGSVSASFSQSRANGDFSSVREQSGVQAGVGGFKVKVKGLTSLDGGKLASAAPETANTFSTGALITKDVENHANASVSSSGFGVSTAVVGNNYEAGKALAGGLLGQGSAKQSATSSTGSFIAQGAITITDSQRQQDLTGQDAAQTIAEVRRSQNHQALDRPDLAGMQAGVEETLATNALALEAIGIHTDLAYDEAQARKAEKAALEAPGRAQGPAAQAGEPLNKGDGNRSENTYTSGMSSSGPNSSTGSVATPEAGMETGGAGGESGSTQAGAYRFSSTGLFLPPSDEADFNSADYSPRSRSQCINYYENRKAAGDRPQVETPGQAFVRGPNGEWQPVVQVASLGSDLGALLGKGYDKAKEKAEDVLVKVQVGVSAFQEWSEKNGNQLSGWGRITDTEVEQRLVELAASGPQGAEKAMRIRTSRDMSEAFANTLGAMLGAKAGGTAAASTPSLSRPGISFSGEATLTQTLIAVGVAEGAGAAAVPFAMAMGRGKGPGGSKPQDAAEKKSPTPNPQGQYKPAPDGNLDGTIKAKMVKSKSNRARWKDDKGNIYEWDSQHGKVEKYNKAGKHLGEFDHTTGQQTKPSDPTRRIEK